jgi:EAL domain-containing protein (putative c-di-GMP-specific phosphodiesterase class I)
VEVLEGGRQDTALVQAILALAQGLDLDVVAEGIETPGQRQLLKLLGCHLGQGYLFARPRPAHELCLAPYPDGHALAL